VATTALEFTTSFGVRCFSTALDRVRASTERGAEAPHSIDARSGPPHRGHGVVAGLQACDVRPHGLDAADALVAQDEEAIAGRRRAVLRGVALAVGAVDAEPEDLHEDAAAAGHALERREGKLGEMDAVRLSWNDRDGSRVSFSASRESA